MDSKSISRRGFLAGAAKAGVRYIPVYDDSGTIKVGEFEIECGFLE